MAKMKFVDAGPMMLLPPAKGLCQECAIDHDPRLPHNRDSFYYQTKFNIEHGRAPDWQDAMAHCEPQMRVEWERGLRNAGVWKERASERPRPINRHGFPHRP